VPEGTDRSRKTTLGMWKMREVRKERGGSAKFNLREADSSLSKKDGLGERDSEVTDTMDEKICRRRIVTGMKIKNYLVLGEHSVPLKLSYWVE